MIPRRTFLLALAPALAACTSPLGGGSPPQLYTLSAVKDFPPTLPKTNAQLLIEAPSAPGGLDRERLALRADYVLEPDLRDFTAIYGQTGMPVARVRMGLKLVRLPEKQIVAQR